MLLAVGSLNPGASAFPAASAGSFDLSLFTLLTITVVENPYQPFLSAPFAYPSYCCRHVIIRETPDLGGENMMCYAVDDH
jgi:hypothetical protein